MCVRQGGAATERAEAGMADRAQSDFNFFVGPWKEEPGDAAELTAGWRANSASYEPPHKRQNCGDKRQSCGEADLTEAFCDPFLGSPLTPLPLLSLT